MLIFEVFLRSSCEKADKAAEEMVESNDADLLISERFELALRSSLNSLESVLPRLASFMLCSLSITYPLTVGQSSSASFSKGNRNSKKQHFA